MGRVLGSDFYDKGYAENNDYSSHYSDSRYLFLWEKVISELRNKKLSVLDLGCGPGQLAHLFFDRGYRNYLGVDFSEEAIKKAKNFSTQKFIIRDINRLNFVNLNYDVYLLIEVLEHIDDIYILKKIPFGKKILITVPDFASVGHVRYFSDIKEVVCRYSDYIDIKKVEKIRKHFILKGTINVQKR